VVLGRFDRKNFRCQKNQLNANKKNSKKLFVNQGTKLYVIMQFILKSQKSFNPAFKHCIVDRFGVEDKVESQGHNVK